MREHCLCIVIWKSIIVSDNIWKIFEGEMLIRTSSKTLLQITYRIILNSTSFSKNYQIVNQNIINNSPSNNSEIIINFKVIVKNTIDPDDNVIDGLIKSQAARQ